MTPAVTMGAATLCAVGFTVPLLFADVIYGSGVAYRSITVGLLLASVVATVVGVAVLRFALGRGKLSSLNRRRSHR